MVAVPSTVRDALQLPCETPALATNATALWPRTRQKCQYHVLLLFCVCTFQAFLNRITVQLWLLCNHCTSFCEYKKNMPRVQPCIPFPWRVMVPSMQKSHMLSFCPPGLTHSSCSGISLRITSLHSRFFFFSSSLFSHRRHKKCVRRWREQLRCQGSHNAFFGLQPQK